MNSFLSKIAHDSLSILKPRSKLKIESVVIGIRYTYVLLSSGSCGIAYTLTDHLVEKETHKQYLSEKYFYKKDLEYLIDYCTSKYSIFRSVGLATLNALSQAFLPLKDTTHQDISALFPNKSESIGMIGDIQPVRKSLAQKGHRVKILDRFAPPLQHSRITTVEGISDLENVDHLIVSGSALVFDTFDQVRNLLSTISGEKVLLGPSAQILPEVAFKHGFTFIGSSRIMDASSTKRIIMEGGGYRAFKAFTKKYAYQRT